MASKFVNICPCPRFARKVLRALNQRAAARVRIRITKENLTRDLVKRRKQFTGFFGGVLRQRDGVVRHQHRGYSEIQLQLAFQFLTR